MPNRPDDSRHTAPVSIELAKLRWRIERDYQELKQELGLGHYEGRGWRAFHHHATLAIAAYGFLLSERATISLRTMPPSTQPSACTTQRSTDPIRLQRHVSNSIATIRSLPRCPCCQHISLMTQ